MKDERRLQKFFELQQKVLDTFSPEMLDYLEAKLSYVSEMESGYSPKHQAAAELRLIEAMEKLLAVSK